jgi:multidrug efflux pump subunit AcrB
MTRLPFPRSRFRGLTRAYDYTLRKTLKHRFITVLFAIAMLGGTVYLFLTMPRLHSSQDSGFIFGITMAGQDISFESWPGIRTPLPKSRSAINVSNIGAFVPGGNQGFIFARLKPRRNAKYPSTNSFKSCGPSCGRFPA